MNDAAKGEGLHPRESGFTFGPLRSRADHSHRVLALWSAGRESCARQAHTAKARRCSLVPRSMGLQLASAVGKMFRPSETAEMLLIGFMCLVIIYAARVVYLAPKTTPPKWKRYEEEKRQRKLYEYERQQKEGLVRRRASTQPGLLLPSKHTPLCVRRWSTGIEQLRDSSAMRTTVAIAARSSSL